MAAAAANGGGSGDYPQIQKLADRSDMIFEVPKCSKMQALPQAP